MIVCDHDECDQAPTWVTTGNVAQRFCTYHAADAAISDLDRDELATLWRLHRLRYEPRATEIAMLRAAASISTRIPYEHMAVTGSKLKCGTLVWIILEGNAEQCQALRDWLSEFAPITLHHEVAACQMDTL